MNATALNSIDTDKLPEALKTELCAAAILMAMQNKRPPAATDGQDKGIKFPKKGHGEYNTNGIQNQGNKRGF